MTLLDVLNSCGQINRSARSRRLYRSTLEKSAIYSKYLCVDTNAETIEIPIFFKTAFESTIAAQNFNCKCVLPLYSDSGSTSRGTAASAVTHMFNSHAEYNLDEVNIKGETYYGGQGIILKDNLSPLFMLTLQGQLNSERSGVTYNKAICRIDPSVHADPKNTINKLIITKIIPYYLANGVFLPRASRVRGFRCAINTHLPTSVIIEPFNHFFIAPTEPVISTTFQEDLNNCLIEHIEDLLSHDEL